MCCLKCILSNLIECDLEYVTYLYLQKRPATSLQIVSAKFSNNISHTCVYYFLFSAKLNANNFHLHLAKNVWLRIEVSPITQLQNCVLETSFFDRKSDLKLKRQCCMLLTDGNEAFFCKLQVFLSLSSQLFRLDGQKIQIIDRHIKEKKKSHNFFMQNFFNFQDIYY